MRVLVTGAAGFIGSHLCERLLAEGHSVVGVDSFDPYYGRDLKEANLSAARGHASFSFIECDVRDEVMMKEALDGVSAVFHLAARPGVRPSFDDPDAYFEINASATRDLLRSVRDASVERFVLASSSSVYGDGAAAPFREDGELGTPLSPYSGSKRQAEEICSAAHGDVAVTIVRIFTAYGPRQRPDLAISRFARLILEEQPLPLFDEGRGRRDFTYVGDLVSGLVACLDLPIELHVLNLGSGNPIGVGTVVSELERALGRTARVELLPPARGDMPLTHADIERAQRLLDYAPATSFRAGIDLFVDWFFSERPSP